MNVWQVAQQLKYLIGKRRWEGAGGNELVLTPIVTAGLPSEFLKDARLPFVLITPQGGPADEEEPNLWDERFRLVIVAGVEGDEHGEFSLIGGARSGGQGSSRGRGLLEILPEVIGAIDQLSSGLGLDVQGRNQDGGDAAQDERLGYITNRVLNYMVKCSSYAYYHPAEVLQAEDDTGGECTLSWQLPPDRFDRRMMMLRRAAGSTPPATIADGTEIPLASDLATGHTDDPGAGTFSYSVFAGYRELTDTYPPTTGTPDRWSDPASVTVTVT